MPLKNVLGKIGNFISNMFQNLLGKVVNGALCAIEQFVPGIFAKMFDSLEGALRNINEWTELVSWWI